MKKTAAGFLGLIAKTFTANSPSYTIVDSWGEDDCPESLLE